METKNDENRGLSIDVRVWVNVQWLSFHKYGIFFKVVQMV